ncbi:MAG: hypothetical protein ABSF09_10230 [Candidatus Bathyarchaeia archaeon]|jgi:hypothetical protein
MDDREENQKKMELLSQLTLNSYNQIIENSRQLDQKTHNIIALTSTLLPILLGLFYYLGKNAIGLAIFPYTTIFIALGILLFILAIVKGGLTYRTFSYKALDPYKFASTHVRENLADVMEATISTLGDMTSQNWEVGVRKAKSYEITVRFMTVGAVMFGVGFLLLVFGLAYPQFVRLFAEVLRSVSALTTYLFL